MRDFICDAFSHCARRCGMGEISLHDKIVIENSKEREKIMIDKICAHVYGFFETKQLFGSIIYSFRGQTDARNEWALTSVILDDRYRTFAIDTVTDVTIMSRKEHLMQIDNITALLWYFDLTKI